MTYKDTIKSKVPSDIQRAPEFCVLLCMLERENIASTDELRHHIDAREKDAQAAMDNNNGASTSNDHRRRLAQEIEFFHTVREKILPYL